MASFKNVTLEKINEIKEFYKDFEVQNKDPNKEKVYSKEEITVSIYNNNTVLFQGNNSNSHEQLFFGNNKMLKQNTVINEKDYDLIAYVDGSYHKELGIFTYGLIILYKNQELNFNQQFNNKKWAKLGNVAGEIMGVVKAIQFAVEQNFKSILIYHDYNELSNWVTGKSKTNKIETEAYKEFCHEQKEHMKIDFISVKAHSGIIYNEIADKLAKAAYNLPEKSEVLLESNFVYIDKDKLQDFLTEILKLKYNSYNLQLIEATDKHEKIEININNQKITMIFYFKNTGAMTIAYEGQNTQLGSFIKNELESKYSLKSKLPNSYFSLAITSTKWEKFKKELNNIDNINISKRNTNIPHVKEAFELALKGNNIICTFFKTGKIVFQGRSSILMLNIISLLNTIINVNSKDIVNIFNALYQKQIPINEIENELKKLAMYSYNKINSLTKNFLICSITNSKIKKQIQTFDYSDVCYHSLKAIEAQMNDILSKYNNLPIKNGNYNFGAIFSKNSKTNLFILNKTQMKIIKDSKIISNLESLYNYYNKERHSLFHTNPILIQTRIINYNEAYNIMLNCIKIIDNCYK